MRWPILLVLLLPVASAAAFEGEMDDRPDDVVSVPGRPASSPSTDVLRFRSSVDGTTVEQRVEMAAPPEPALDSIIVRSWFRNSTNGSFHVVDLEVHADAPEADRLKAFTRRGEFTNVSPIDATYAIKDATWVFRFDLSVAPDAECFLPMVYAYRREPSVFDSLGMGGRPCATAPEPPGQARPDPQPTTSAVPPEPPTSDGASSSAVEPPGTRSPALGLSILGFLLVIALLIALRRR